MYQIIWYYIMENLITYIIPYIYFIQVWYKPSMSSIHSKQYHLPNFHVDYFMYYLDLYMLSVSICIINNSILMK